MGIPLRVLIVEDSEDDTLLLVRELQHAGYDVTFERVETAKDMADALDNRQWDIVLADYTMPHFSGTDALRLLREKGFDIPFIFVSGTIGEDTAVLAMKSGANDYILKGNLKRLIPAIERELREAEVRRERRKAEEQLHESYQTLTVLNKILVATLQPVPLESLLDMVIDHVVSIPWLSLETERGIFLAEDGWLILKTKRNLPASLQTMCARIPFGRCLCGRAALSGKIEFADRIDERHEIKYEGIPPHGHYCVPIKSADRILGVINLFVKEGHVRNEREEDFLNAIANVLAGIIQLKQAEDLLRKSEERYKRLLESITDYIYTVIVENGCPVSTIHGPGCAAITGYTSEEYAADPYLWYKMVYDEDKELVIEQLNKVLSGKEVKPLEHRIIHKNGSIRWVRNTIVARYDEQGRVIAYDGLITDITEQKRIEEQLRHAQKMEAIGQLAGGIAHDFNNILNVIMGFGSLIEMNLKEDDPNRIHLKEILNAGERATHLTRALLAFSRKQIIEPKPQNLNEIIKGFEKILRRIIGEDIELKTELSEKDLTVFVDRGQIEQVLMNLATNARDAMPDGGDLIIETGTIQIDEEYIKRHGYGEPGIYALLSVTDSGIGMDEKTRERIFEPFFTTKEAGRGTGLGLAMVYGIIKQHDGFINVYSELGKGTTFKIYLPLIMSEVKEERIEPTAYPEGGKETVLVAEDDQAVRKLTRDILERFGYKVIAAEDGEDAIEKFINNKEDIKLLLLDVIMPKKNGKEVYEEIKKINPGIKALFLSGYTANLIHKKGILDEGLNFILKPVSPKELLRKVREVLDS